MFSHAGFDACSIETITERADVGKGTFYRHFVDKPAILLGLTESAISLLIDMVRSSPAPAKTLDDALASILSAQISFQAHYPAQASVLAQAQTLLAVRPERLEGLEIPFRTYQAAIEERLKPFLPSASGSAVNRRLACAVAAAVPGFVCAATIGLDRNDVPAALEACAKAFRAGAGQWLI